MAALSLDKLTRQDNIHKNSQAGILAASHQVEVLGLPALSVGNRSDIQHGAIIDRLPQRQAAIKKAAAERLTHQPQESLPALPERSSQSTGA